MQLTGLALLKNQQRHFVTFIASYVFVEIAEIVFFEIAEIVFVERGEIDSSKKIKAIFSRAFAGEKL